MLAPYREDPDIGHTDGGFTVRAETRRDYSNHLYFQDKSDGTPRKIQQSYALELVVSMPS